MASSPPLQQELRVMMKTERLVLKELGETYSEISRELLELTTGPTSMLERAQLQELKRAIKRELADYWRRAGDEIRAGRIEAAGIAAELPPEAAKLFVAAGLTAIEVETLQRSLRLGAESAVNTALQRMKGRSYIPLSSRVYYTSALVNHQLDHVINRAMLREVNSRKLAKAVRDFIRPDTPGGVRYASTRLARTEINNAFHASTVDTMRSEPFVTAAKWNLSGSHARPDVCNDYAEEPHIMGGEAGVWSLMDVPDRPHPNCLCFVTALTVGDEEFISSFVTGKYDDWLRSEGVDPG